MALLHDYLALLPADLRYAFEFRHASWLAEPVYDELRQRNVSLCVAESERLEVPEVITADFVYFRLRKPDYTADDVAGIRRAVAGTARDGARSVSDVQARRNARRRAQRGNAAEGRQFMIKWSQTIVSSGTIVGLDRRGGSRTHYLKSSLCEAKRARRRVCVSGFR